LNTRALGKLRDTLQWHIDKERIPGAIAVVASGGQVAMFESMGQQDPQAGTAMKSDAIFRIYSMTKPLVSLAATMLSEEGLLAMGDPVSKYLPEFARPHVALMEEGGLRKVPARREPTIQDLLRHTSGLTYDFLGDNPVQQLYKAADLHNRDITITQWRERIANLPLQDQPGSCWQYSMSTDVLGAVLEVVSGTSLDRLLQQRIFEPLGMKDTAFSVPRELWGRLAEPFDNDPDTGLPVTMIDPKVVPQWHSGGGGLMSTADDYLKFLQLMRGKGSFNGTRLLSRKTVEWMTADHLGDIVPNGDLLIPGYGFGLGFAVRTHAGLAPQPGSVGQFFWSGIGGTSFFVDPQEDIFAMLLTQAPNQRIFFRNLFRHLVYAAVD